MSRLLRGSGSCSGVEVHRCGQEGLVLTPASGSGIPQIGGLAYRLRFFFFRLSRRSFWRLDL